MSKAFTRESDDAPDQPLTRPPSSLPPGVKNYITPDGERRLREELDRLTQTKPPGPSAVQRMAQLHQILQSSVVVTPPALPEEQVKFGATVTVRNRAGQEECYRLVGVDEIDMDQNWISWRSPLAQALLKARRGQRVRFRIPAGEEELEIVSVAYE